MSETAVMRDTLRIASELGIYVHFIDDFNELLGMYTYRHKERHILLNSRMEDMVLQMVCGHEIGHDSLHRSLAKESNSLRSLCFLICVPNMNTRQTLFPHT